MTEQVAGECATLSREDREGTFGDDCSGPWEVLLEQRDEYVTPESSPGGPECAIPVEPERTPIGPDRTPVERDEPAPAEQSPVDQSSGIVEESPGTRSRLAAVLAEIGRWRADALK